MKIIGVTGSIAMGKSTASAMLARMGCPVHNADQVVHQLMARGGAAVEPVAALFPDALRQGAIHRPTLGQAVFGQPERLAQLEAVLHPMVHRALKRFLLDHQRVGRPAVVIDVPLLFEVKADRRCDMVLVVDCSPALQQQRFLQRPGAKLEKLRAIRAHQMPQAEKRRRADRIIPTGAGKAATWQALAAAHRRVLSADWSRPPVWPIDAYQNPSFRGALHTPRLKGL